MKKLKLPADQAGWEKLVAALVRANLALADMDQGDLSQALREMGVEQSPSNISAKLRQGRFSATFFLQALVAAGVEEIELPRRGV